MHRSDSDSVEDAEESGTTATRESILTKASTVRLVVASVLTLGVIVGVLINSATKGSPPVGNSHKPNSQSPTSAGQPSAPVMANEAPQPFPIDGQGFINTDARCAPTESAVAAGRTEKSLVVVCKAGDGRLEYKGLRLSLKTGVSVGNVAADADGFVAHNETTTYVVTPAELVIRSADAVLAREPMVDFRRPQAARAPAGPPSVVAAPPVASVVAPPSVLAAPPVTSVAAPAPPPPGPAPAQPLSKPIAGYPPLPVAARGSGNGIVRFTATRPWQIRYLVRCPADIAVRGSINAGASYMRYHVDLQGDPNAPVQGTSGSRDQSGPILISITLADQRCGWELAAT